MSKILLKKIRVQIPNFGFQELAVPELIGKDFSLVWAETEDGVRHALKAGHKPGLVTITFKDQKPRAVVTVSVFIKDANEAPPEKKPAKIKKIISLIVKKPTARRSKIPFFESLQARQADRIELNEQANKAIRETDLSHKNLAGQNILTFDFTGCWARGLGMIQKASQLQHQLNVPFLYRHFDRIAGQGDGAIMAAAIAGGITLERLGEWWLSDWRKGHAPGTIKKLQRWAKSKVRPNESGYDAKQARAALRRLFVKNSVDLRMKDVLCDLQVTVTQASLKITTHYSQANPEMELYTAVEDSAVTKIHYNQKETVQGEAVFLGAIEKNDDMGLALSEDNKNMRLTSIGAPVRINPPAARKLGRLGHAADKVALQSGSHFVYKKRIEQLIKKLADAGFQIYYHRLECAPIDGIVANDTSDAGMRAGIESGSGQLEHVREEKKHANVG
jgi:hypothetical protein